MRSAIGLALLAAAVAVPALAQDKPAEDEKLYGTWRITRIAEKGRESSEEESKAAYTFSKGGKMNARNAVGKVTDQGRYQTAAAKPGKDFREIDLVFLQEDGTPVDQVSKGIYRIDGDTLKLAYSQGGGKRPTSFDPAQGIVYTCKRESSPR
jgi:uncharacterized protein (TIGR03067 family)